MHFSFIDLFSGVLADAPASWGDGGTGGCAANARVSRAKGNVRCLLRRDESAGAVNATMTAFRRSFCTRHMLRRSIVLCAAATSFLMVVQNTSGVKTRSFCGQHSHLFRRQVGASSCFSDNAPDITLRIIAQEVCIVNKSRQILHISPYKRRAAVRPCAIKYVVIPGFPVRYVSSHPGAASRPKRGHWLPVLRIRQP